MSKSFVYGFILIAILSCNSPSKPNRVESGVSKLLADDRKQQIQNVNYELAFKIPKEKTKPIHANLILTFEVLNTRKPLILDFKPNHQHPIKVIRKGEVLEVTQIKEHIIIPNKYLKKGTNQFEIEFQAGDLSLNRNEDFLYTLLVPDRARTLFPCFDQPNIKARYKLQLEVPKNWKVLSSAPIKNTFEKDGFTTYDFDLSDKMSTYLFSFVAGQFKSAINKKNELLYRENNSAKIKFSLPNIFKLHTNSIAFLENYTHKAYPFKKLDFAAIPAFQYGGMEHVGAIQYRESSLFLDQSATINQQLNRAKLIAHESAHMWFGNLVTMDWFDDVWLKEVFANFMADKIVNPNFTTINHELQFLTGHYPTAFNVDRTSGSNAIKQPLKNLQNAGSLYGNIIYHKAPIMMRQLELLLGEENFKEGMQSYIDQFAFGNATWEDLVKILDKKTTVDIEQWSNVWVHQPGRPIFTSKISFLNNLVNEIHISQNAEDGSSNFWPQQFEISLVYPKKIVSKKIDIHNPQQTIDVFKGLAKPSSIIYNSNGYGYGVFPIDSVSISQNHLIKNDLTRAQNYINIFENALSGRISVALAIASFNRGLTYENNALILQNLRSNCNTLYWYFLNAKERNFWQAKFCENIWNRLQSNSSANIKKELFLLFTTIAYQGKSLDNLYRIWNKDIQIDQLNLNQNNYTAIAMQLALYNPSKASAILATAKNQIKNKDQLNRFDFLQPALSNNQNKRTAFFQSFKEEKNRVKESWVAAACHYIHHPLRQNEAIHDLPLSLSLLEEIQQTGDIFFPKSWLDNTIGQYNNEQAKALVETYLEQNPNLNPQLKSKLLQSTDNLFRAQKLLPKP